MVIWSKPARADLKAIHDFIANNSYYYAKKVVQDLRKKVNLLDQMPRIGKNVSEVDDKNVRELSLYSYRIIYEITTKNIFILAVVHNRRDFKAKDIKG